MNVTQSKAGNKIAVNAQQVHLVPIKSYQKRKFLLHQLKKNMDEEVVQEEIRQTSVLGVTLKL